MDINHAFGEVLRTYRKQKDFSQEALALSCDVDRTFISLLERGERQPSLSTIFSLAEALETSPSNLVEAVEKLTSKSKKKKA